jgi:hypothetical protein
MVKTFGRVTGLELQLSQYANQWFVKGHHPIITARTLPFYRVPVTLGFRVQHFAGAQTENEYGPNDQFANEVSRSPGHAKTWLIAQVHSTKRCFLSSQRYLLNLLPS